jgi:Fe-S-cluster containining protein
MPLIEEFLGLEGHAEFLSRLAGIYAGMDEAYGRVASHYGFGCQGCQDNCCTQRFQHHTLAEFFYLFEGLRNSDEALAREMLSRAREVVVSYHAEAGTGRVLALMCPANFEGLCRLYEHRPMICRLHGLPHEFRRPDGFTARGGGCLRFQQMNPDEALRVDRTEFYRALAMLEGELRGRLGYSRRYGKTTAEMLVDMAGQLGRRPE